MTLFLPVKVIYLQCPNFLKSSPCSDIRKRTSPNRIIAVPPTWNSLSPGVTVLLWDVWILQFSFQPEVAPQIVLSYSTFRQSLLTSVNKVISTSYVNFNFLIFSIFKVSLHRLLVTNPMPPGFYNKNLIQSDPLRQIRSPWWPLSWSWSRLWPVSTPLVWATSHDRGCPGHNIRAPRPLQTKRYFCWLSSVGKRVDAVN